MWGVGGFSSVEEFELTASLERLHESRREVREAWAEYGKGVAYLTLS